MPEYIATAQVKIVGDFKPLEKQLREFQGKIKATIEGQRGIGGGGGFGAAGGAIVGAAGGAAAASGIGKGLFKASSMDLQTNSIKDFVKALNTGRDVLIDTHRKQITIMAQVFGFVRMWRDLKEGIKNVGNALLEEYPVLARWGHLFSVTASAIKASISKIKAFITGFVKFTVKAFAVMAAGIYASIKLIGKHFDDLEESANLSAVLKATGGAAGYTKDQLNGMAKALSESTNFTDSQITSAQALLATFNQIKGKTFESALNAALDLSQVFKQDLKSSAVQLGKALQDPLKGMNAMARVGVSFSAAQQEQIKNLVKTNKLTEAQKIILTAVKGQVGGAAKEAANPLTQIKNAFGELVERAGQFVADIFGINNGFKNIQGLLINIVKKFDEFRKTEEYVRIVTRIRMVVRLIGEYAIVLGKILLWIGKLVDKVVVGAFVNLSKVLAHINAEWADGLRSVFEEYQSLKNAGTEILPQFFKGTSKLIANEEEITEQIKKQTKEIKRQFGVISGAESLYDDMLESYNRVFVEKNKVELPQLKPNDVFFRGMFAPAGFKDENTKAVEEQTDILDEDLKDIAGLLKTTTVFA